MIHVECPNCSNQVEMRPSAVVVHWSTLVTCDACGRSFQVVMSRPDGQARWSRVKVNDED